MPPLPDIIAGPWRAVLVLGVTEILAWGAIFYPPVLTVPLIAHERGWSMTFAMGGFSLALLTAGVVSPRVRKVDRPARRTSRHADRLAHCRARSRLDRLRRSSRRLPRGLAAARRRHRCDPLRSSLCHARSHLRRRRAAADHGAHACRGLRLDGELARDPCFARGRGMARHLSRLCRAACFGRGAAARLRIAAHARQRRGAVRPIGTSAERRPAADRLAFLAGGGSLRSL